MRSHLILRRCASPGARTSVVGWQGSAGLQPGILLEHAALKGGATPLRDELERLCGLGVTTLRILNRAEVGVDLGNVRSQAGEFPERRAGGVPIFAASACSACCE